MKTFKLLSLALLTAAFSVKAQEIQNRTISPFSKIETSGSVNVYFTNTNSDSLSLSVKARSSELENVETKVENGTLIVSNKGNFSAPVYIYVKSNQLKQVQSSGASSFKMLNVLKSDSILFSVSGSANVYATVNMTRVKSVQSGASMLTLSGTTDNFFAELSGASSLKAYQLISKNMDILATGASSSKVYVTDKLRANASGASSIKIKGEVKDISAEASTASSISKIAEKTKADGKDSTEIQMGRRKIIIIDKGDEGLSIKRDSTGYDKDDFRHWAGISFGVNGYMSSPGNIGLAKPQQYMDLNYGRSFNFQFNIVERQFNIVRNNFKIVTGFGFDYHSYDLANKIILDPDSSFTFGAFDSTNNFSYKKNRLRATYLQVPLLFEFNTSNNPDKTFHIAFGVIGQYLIASRTRQVIEEKDFELTRVRKDGYNMSPFAAKAHVNIGYKGFTVFGEYSLTPLFQSGKGPELYPFSVGIRIIPFT